MQSPHLRSGELCFPFFRVDYLHKLYGIPYGMFVFSTAIIYLLNNYLCQYIYFFFGMSFLSGTITFFQTSLLSSFLSPKNNYFSRMSGLFYWIMVLETNSECCMCLLLKGLSILLYPLR